MYVPC